MLCREQSKRYEIKNIIHSPDDIKELAEKVLEIHKNAEEVLCIVALDIRSKVIGTFEVSRGILGSSVISVREVFKRLFLLNAASFVTIHNHPSGNVSPSKSDIECAHKLKYSGEILDLNMLDFCIIGDNTIFSFVSNELM